jgi:hypothetical protein
MVLLSALVFPVANAEDIPVEIQGKWVVTRIIPTRTITCWDQRQADGLIGTEIEYTSESLRWKDLLATHPLVGISEMSAEEFYRKYSGGPADSQVDFKQLGIKAATVRRIILTHEQLKDLGGEFVIPGDEVLVKDPNTIIFSVCNVYFEARRKSTPKSPRP